MRTSLRSLLASLLALVGVLVAALFVLALLQLRGSAAQVDAENRRTSSIVLAESVRSSSDDLTMMVRLYVSTGEPRYRRYYDQILAIRGGDVPRPVDYSNSFWDRVLAEGEDFVTYGPPESLQDQMRDAGFSGAEFEALDRALETSDSLAEVEVEVMRAVAPRIDRGVDGSYAADVAGQYDRLVDRDYLMQKSAIMAAIDDFIALVEHRTLRDVDRASDHNRLLARLQIGVLAVVVLAGIAAMVAVSRLAVRPLDDLTRASRRIADGAYDERADPRGVAELTHVATAFNEMAGAVQKDIAAREAAEHEAVAAQRVAEHASRAKSTFLAAMSHEIRTPMIGVTGMLEVLRRTDLSGAQQHMVATAEASAQSLLQIIGDVLDFSKIEADKLELLPVVFDLRATVRAAVETFVHTASAKALLLEWSSDERLASAHRGDAVRIRQIVSNLLSNAVKFTSAGGIEVTVEVEGEADGGSTATQHVAITVTDTGAGVSPEEQARLFENFAQATGTTGGTGLGLVICKRLARLMGGDVTMDSAPGRGTVMRLTVPLEIADPADLPPVATTSGAHLSRPKPTREQALAEGSLLLLAEDHPVNRTVLRAQLDVIGFEADFAEDGEQAWQLFQQTSYAVVITDLNMPERDGYSLARAIRDWEAETGAPRTPIVALSANVMSGEVDRCREAGMDDFAAKPITIPALTARLRRWLPTVPWPEPEPAQPAVAGGDTDAVPSAGIDPTVLDELTGGDAELAGAIMEDFLVSTRVDLDELEAALEQHQLDALHRLAHRIKGAARIVGASRFADLAHRLESATGQDADWAELAVVAAELRAAFDLLAR